MSKAQKIFPYPQDQKLDKDLKQIYDWVSRLELVTTNPDGTRVGKVTGEAVILQAGGKTYLEVCNGANTTVWLGVQLTNTP